MEKHCRAVEHDFAPRLFRGQRRKHGLTLLLRLRTHVKWMQTFGRRCVLHRCDTDHRTAENEGRQGYANQHSEFSH